MFSKVPDLRKHAALAVLRFDTWWELRNSLVSCQKHEDHGGYFKVAKQHCKSRTVGHPVPDQVSALIKIIAYNYYSIWAGWDTSGWCFSSHHVNLSRLLLWILSPAVFDFFHVFLRICGKLLAKVPKLGSAYLSLSQLRFMVSINSSNTPLGLHPSFSTICLGRETQRPLRKTKGA